MPFLLPIALVIIGFITQRTILKITYRDIVPPRHKKSSGVNRKKQGIRFSPDHYLTICKYASDPVKKYNPDPLKRYITGLTQTIESSD